jgi:NAD(P)H-flavin reductase
LRILRLIRPRGLDFRSGQHVKLAVAGARRKYTMVSAPHEDELEFFIERAPGGGFTPALWSLGVGDRVRVEGPAKGRFTFDGQRRDHVMVATVTGIGPFVSMARAHASEGDAYRFHVLHGASYADELEYGDELERHSGVRYLPTVSRPAEARNAGWAGATGRVDEHVLPYLEAQGLAPDTTAVYACGHPGMVKTVRDRLAPLGYRVYTESYF